MFFYALSPDYRADHCRKVANNLFENVAIMVANQNFIHRVIKSRLNLGNACYQFTIFCLPICYLKHVKIKIYKPVYLVSYGCETRSHVKRRTQIEEVWC
jgi:hypothetical protein